MSDVFHFKKFSVLHDKSAMKVGTDGVLLGAWCSAENASSALDAGTGSGVIALMLAQRNPILRITGIDIDQNSVTQAEQNFSNSPWPDRLQAEHTSLQEYALSHKGKLDLIISNPPFFHPGKNLTASETGRANARAGFSMDQEDILNACDRLLKENGRLSLILPVIESEQFIRTAKERSWHLIRLTTVRPVKYKDAHRMLMEFSRVKSSLSESELIIQEGGRNEFTRDYEELLREFLTIL